MSLFEEELLNNVRERFSNKCDEDTYQKISVIFMEEHLKLLRHYEMRIKSQVDGLTYMLESVRRGVDLLSYGEKYKFSQN